MTPHEIQAADDEALIAANIAVMQARLSEVEAQAAGMTEASLRDEQVVRQQLRPVHGQLSETALRGLAVHLWERQRAARVFVAAVLQPAVCWLRARAPRRRRTARRSARAPTGDGEPAAGDPPRPHSTTSRRRRACARSAEAPALARRGSRNSQPDAVMRRFRKALLHRLSSPSRARCTSAHPGVLTR